MRPQGEISGATNLVKITEDVQKFAAEQGVTEAKALERGIEVKSHEFVQKGVSFTPKRNI